MKLTLKNSEHRTDEECVQDQMNNFQPKSHVCSK